MAWLHQIPFSIVESSHYYTITSPYHYFVYLPFSTMFSAQTFSPPLEILLTQPILATLRQSTDIISQSLICSLYFK
ncbi:hypothetical protein BDV3_004803 [Batrachochytrium dendrobatidis]